MPASDFGSSAITGGSKFSCKAQTTKKWGYTVGGNFAWAKSVPISIGMMWLNPITLLIYCTASQNTLFAN
ncbi:hypothetical protein BGS_0840 [Beggiatoa sp. SS]|nr:hypothetical protein BGS_0840 [Beggiatoa sp. SS]